MIVIGTALNDPLIGTAGEDEIFGLAGNDALFGLASADLLDGGLGNDSMTGGSGNDTYIVDALLDAVIEVPDEGEDTIESFVNIAALVANVENLVLVGAALIGTGNLLDNAIFGNALANTLDGKAGADLMTGGAGNDAYVVDNADDLVFELFGEGIDTVTASVSFTLDEDIENLVLVGAALIGTGNALNNLITGNASANVLTGGGGNDILVGGDGNDTYVVDSATDVVTESNALPAGSIDLVLASSNYTLGLNVEQLTLTGGANLNGTGNASNNLITGNTGNNLLAGALGNDTLSGDAGQDTLAGGAGADSLIGGADADVASYAGSAAAVTVDLETDTASGGDAAGDTYSGIEGVAGGLGADRITGDADANVLSGDAANDTLVGAGGNDTLTGGAGFDSMAGGLGDDTYIADSPGDIVSEFGGGGIDTVESSSTFRLREGVENLILTGVANSGGTGSNGANSIIGNSGRNILTGRGGDDTLAGGANSDRLYGGLGNDILAGGAGADQLRGEAGSDTADYSASGAAVSVDLGAQTASGGDAAGDTLFSIENATGSEFADALTGSGAANTIEGLGGDDTIAGLAGADDLAGGAGNDLLDYAASAGAVNVDLAASTASGGDAAGDTISGFEHVRGGAGNDMLAGDEQANSLSGGAGNDTVTYAASGAAVNVNLGTGTASGGDAEGDVLLSVENVIGSAYADTFAASAAANLIAGGGGIDTVTYAGSNSGVSITLGGGAGTGGNAAGDALTGIENLVGSAHDDALTGDAAANEMEGGEGDDTLVGAGGNDTLTGGAGADDMDGGANEDVADYSGSAQGVSVNLATGAGSGGDAAGDALSNIEHLIGSGLDDTLGGAAGANSLSGGAGTDTADYSQSSAAVSVNLATGAGSGGHAAGDTLDSIEAAIGSAYNDTLSGGPGATTLSGGAGDDAYYVDGDTVVEAAGGGFDTVYASTSFDLAAAGNVENLQLIGADLSGTGNALANMILGTAGANVLSGMGGNDTLIGGAGADLLDGGANADTADYSASASGVTVNLSTSTGSGGDAAGDTLQGIENLIGSAFDDAFTGSAAANNLAGGSGNDSVDYSLSAGAVIVNLASGTGLGGDAAGDVLGSIEALIGSTGNDSLTGGSGANTLSGGAGDDQLEGGAGADSLSGGAGFDTVSYSGSAGAVSIDLGAGTVSGGDAAGDAISSIEAAIGGSANDSMTGSSAANLLSGGAGNDTIAGLAGADVLDGGAGSDLLDYAASVSGVTVNLGASTASGGDAAGDAISGFEHVTGTGSNDVLIGSGASNALTGGGGADVLIGLGGADTLAGGAGTDTADYLASGAAVNVNLSTGIGSGGDADGDTLTGVENVIGSAYGDTLTGDTGANELRGGGGNDSVSAGSGDDALYAEAGNDTLAGGAGADLIDGGANADSADYSASASGVNVNLSTGTGSGGDAAGDTLFDIEHLVGSAWNDTLTGSAVANVLSGGDGDDVLAGLAGADQLLGGAGNDTADYSLSAAAVVVNLATGTGLGGDAAGDVLGSIEVLFGSLFADTLTGDSGANTLEGGAGADVVNGGGGDDSFTYDAADPLIAGGTGTDTLTVSGSGVSLDLTFSAPVQVTGMEVIDLTGNGNNTLVIDAAGLVAQTEGVHTLSVRGNAGDAVNAPGEWVRGADTLIGTDSYAVYTQGAATLQVELDVGRTGIVTAAPVIELSGLVGTNGFRISGEAANDYSGRSVSSAGDVNGDGFDDLIIGAYFADPNGNSFSGASYVVFGQASGFASNLNLSALNGANGFQLSGELAVDRSGFSVSSGGDVNGDGFDDLIVGAYGADPNGNYSGASYVVFGQASGFASNLDLSALNGANGFQLSGEAAGDLSGRSVSSGGDVNGDGFDDLIVGADLADPNGSNSGASYVVFGQASGFASNLNLSALSGANGFQISGEAAFDQSGFSVSSGGDVNGDGFDDLIVGASGADPNGSGSGASYVVFGQASGFGSNLNLTALNGANGFQISGEAAYDFSGHSVSSGGDVNGDGFDDLIVGAYFADPNGSNSGASYVVFGQASGFASNLNLSALNGTNGFQISGEAAFDQSGFSVSSGGDVNGDGFDDLVVGAFRADANGAYSGASYVVFGQASGFGPNLNLSALDGTNGFQISGEAAGDRSGGSVAAGGDVNGDGFDDLIVGAFFADPNGISNSGASYVLFGRDFTNQAAQIGGSGANALTGSAANEILIGGLGNDTLDGAGGNDVLRGGGGNDVFIYDANDRLIDGGTGTDTLTITGSGVTLNLTAAAEARVSGMEVIDLTGSGNNTLTIDDAGLVEQTEGLHVLSVRGNAGDAVNAAGTWIHGADTVIGGDGYAVYTQGAATLQVELDVGRTGIVTAAPVIELSALVGTNGFQISGAAAYDFSGRSVSSAGDVNGDGFDDVIIGASSADPNGTSSGASYVVFGQASGFASNLNLSALNGANGFRISGEAAFDYSGGSVSSAGDVNGDGFDDLIIGANRADANTITDSGASYVVFGQGSAFASNLNLAALNGANGFQISGEASSDWSGTSVSSAGDVNGDGFDDVIVGAYRADPNTIDNSGASYVVFGQGSVFASNLNLAALNGANGFQISGEATYDWSGFSVSSAGDVNGDGFDDVIVGALLADPNGNTNFGASYVVFGQGSAFASNLDLAALTGTNGFRIAGAAAGDQTGVSVSSAGDVNGDGFDDLFVGANSANANAITDSGAGYVVFGHGSAFAANLDLSALNGVNGFRISGEAASDFSGGSVSSAGDVNGDGFDDLIVGADRADPNGSYSGASYLVFGQASGFGSNLNLTALNGANGFQISGEAAFDNSGGSVSSAGDVNGDGFDDLIVGANGVDPNGNYSGASYVLFGRDFTNVADQIGGSGANALTGSAANEILIGGLGNDTLDGAGGSDVLRGGGGNDAVTGGSGNDVLEGGSGGDLLDGGADADRLYGNEGADTLDGGTGNDTLTGGGDNDVFLFNDALGAANVDTIMDYGGAGTTALDAIHLENAIFTALASPGALNATNFVANATGTATTAAHFIVFNTVTGELYYDADGNAGGAAVKFAVLATDPDGLAATDFVVI